MDDVDAGFHRLVAGLDYPMYIVTAASEGEKGGCLVGFTTQCSIHPVRFVAYLSKKNHTYRVARQAAYLGVHLVGPDDQALAELFGHETGDRVDKLARCRWRPGPENVPILEGPADWFVGRVTGTVDAGDHLGFLLEPVEGGAGAAPRGLGFQSLKGIEPGHEA